MSAVGARRLNGGFVAEQRGSESKRRSRGTKCWSRSVGEYGYTVRIFEIHPGSNLYRSV
jgi:hypothetical protein